MEEFILIAWFKGGDFPLSCLSGPSAASLPSSLNFFLKMPASEIDGEGIRADLEVSDATVVATCLVLTIQSLMSFRNWSRQG
ncbi:hypothetical protein ACE6H2_006519 [Prunus campanulata]